MQTITATGATGGSVTVNLGGIGGDNITGTVTDPSGAAVNDATVTVVKATDQGTDETNSSGKYDIDVNAAVGDRVVVTAEWVDAAGRRHVVRGTVVIATSDVLRPAKSGQDKD